MSSCIKIEESLGGKKHVWNMDHFYHFYIKQTSSFITKLQKDRWPLPYVLVGVRNDQYKSKTIFFNGEEEQCMKVLDSICYTLNWRKL